MLIVTRLCTVYGRCYKRRFDHLFSLDSQFPMLDFIIIRAFDAFFFNFLYLSPSYAHQIIHIVPSQHHQLKSIIEVVVLFFLFRTHCTAKVWLSRNGLFSSVLWCLWAQPIIQAFLALSKSYIMLFVYQLLFISFFRCSSWEHWNSEIIFNWRKKYDCSLSE